MKKSILYIISLLLIFLIGCDDFLDTESYTKKNTSNFPTTQEDANQMITGIYSSMNELIKTPERHPFFIYEMAGDDRFGGGSTSNSGAQSFDRLLNPKISFLEELWKVRYSGIFRANSFFESIDKVTEWDSESKRNELIAEAHFMRAFFYFDLVQIFGEVPLIITTEMQNSPKSKSEEIYKQIAYDLNEAISLFPSTPYPDYPSGHASKWAAQALMARVYLFYTGFYNKSDLMTVDGKTISKQNVINWLKDCIDNSGHELVSDQRNIWQYSNPYTAKDYQYAKDNNLEWEGDGCKETLFALKFSNTGHNGYFNRIPEYFGMRATSVACFPFTPQGY